jgi:hypothetical protein
MIGVTSVVLMTAASLGAASGASQVAHGSAKRGTPGQLLEVSAAPHSSDV